MGFFTEVNLSDRDAMIQFLVNHYRYNTMNSWNNSTSYAHNMKIYKLGLTREECNKLYELMECSGAYNEVNDLITCFDRNYGYKYQAGFNGRQGGYLVLYEGYEKDGLVRTYAGRSIDQGEDFEDWEDRQLVDRVKLVQNFDRLCDAIIEQVKYMANNYEVVEEERQYTEVVKVLREKVA